jgi:hypothetical protein
MRGLKMNVRLHTEEMPGYLAVRFSGATKDAWRQFELIAERCKRANKNKLLLDFTKTYGDLSLAHRYHLGDKAEIFVFYKLMKVAIVGRLEQFDYKKFGEMVARNRWVNARIFTNAEEAEEWLLLRPAATKKSAASHSHAKSSYRAHHSHH